jgi:hypothetical protein
MATKTQAAYRIVVPRPGTLLARMAAHLGVERVRLRPVGWLFPSAPEVRAFVSSLRRTLVAQVLREMGLKGAA